jgi:hypothetical protein
LEGPEAPTYRNVEYEFNAASYDSNEFDWIRYNFTWGDDTYTLTDWDYQSGDTAYASHIWSSTGEFNVTVTAQDSSAYELYSSPSTMSVNVVPETYNIYVEAYDVDLHIEMNPYITIDSSHYGYAPFICYNLAVGEHTIEADSQIYGTNYYFLCFEVDGDYYYDNPTEVEITDHFLPITAWYSWDYGKK